jgi:hypothetical protein
MTGGTVFDIGYQRYTGGREGRGRAWRGVFRDGVRIALGLGRGGRAKVLPWLFIGLLSAIGTVMALVAGAANLMRGDGTAEGICTASRRSCSTCSVRSSRPSFCAATGARE